MEKNPTFAAFIVRAGHEYAKLSATPKDYDAFVAQISKMWETEPNWTDAQMQSIQAPVLVADGDHDEAIKRAHTEYIAATIPGAGLLILPNRASVGGFWAKAAGSFGFSPQIVMWPVWLHRNAARPAALLRQLRVGRKAPLEILKPSKVAR